MANEWTTEHIPDQSKKIVIVTGANSGLGLETTKVLAEKGAKVIMACRNEQKGQAALDELRSVNQDPDLELMALDLASLDSVKAFAEDFKTKYKGLDILINNAGVMMPPYTKTKDGFELQIGTNHFGHFALTGLLLPLLKKSKGRIVNISSMAHRRGKLDLTDLNWERRKYSTTQSYSDSKIANLYFTFELNRKIKVVKCVAAHPGWTETNLQRHSGLFKFLNHFFAQNVEMGALPILRAATDSVRGGEFFGPKGFKGMRGYPVKLNAVERAYDKEIAKKLWQISEKATGVRYDFS